MSRYDSNETMRIIGASEIQYAQGYDRIKPIYAAYIKDLPFFRKADAIEMMADAYALGVMDGKRSERERRKGATNVSKEV